MIQALAYMLLWILLMGVSIFATQNQLVVTLKFLVFESINLPLGLVLVFSAGLGAIAVTVFQAALSSQFVPASRVEPPKKETKTTVKTQPNNQSKGQTKNQKIDDFDQEWDDDWG